MMIPESGDGCGQTSTSERKRKATAAPTMESNEVKDQPRITTKGKKARVVWTDDLKGKFDDAVTQLGTKAVPKKILQVMNVPGLTRENVASHLQKYRLLQNKKMQTQLQDASTNITTSGKQIVIWDDGAHQIPNSIFSIPADQNATAFMNATNQAVPSYRQPLMDRTSHCQEHSTNIMMQNNYASTSHVACSVDPMIDYFESTQGSNMPWNGHSLENGEQFFPQMENNSCGNVSSRFEASNMPLDGHSLGNGEQLFPQMENNNYGNLNSQFQASNMTWNDHSKFFPQMENNNYGNLISSQFQASNIPPWNDHSLENVYPRRMENNNYGNILSSQFQASNMPWNDHSLENGQQLFPQMENSSRFSDDFVIDYPQFEASGMQSGGHSQQLFQERPDQQFNGIGTIDTAIDNKGSDEGKEQFAPGNRTQ